MDLIKVRAVTLSQCQPIVSAFARLPYRSNRNQCIKFLPRQMALCKINKLCTLRNFLLVFYSLNNVGRSEELSTHIIQGHKESLDSYPWLVALIKVEKSTYEKDRNFRCNEREHFCGAVLIADDYLLTAAHCEQSKFDKSGKPIYKTMAAFRDTVFCKLNKKSQKNKNARVIENWILHKDYNKTGKHDNDIAILELEPWQKFQSEFLFENYKYIKPIRITKDTVDSKAEFTIMGWGVFSTDGNKDNHNMASEQLRSGIVHLVPDPSTCSTQENILCSRNHDNPTGKGDSGGPLIFDGCGATVLVGLIRDMISKSIDLKRLRL
jgi:secreted trypsin-like serine protease